MSPTGRVAILILMGAGVELMPSTAHANRFPGATEVGLLLLGAGLVLGIVTGLITCRDGERALRAGLRVGIGVPLVFGVALALLLIVS